MNESEYAQVLQACAAVVRKERERNEARFAELRNVVDTLQSDIAGLQLQKTEDAAEIERLRQRRMANDFELVKELAERMKKHIAAAVQDHERRIRHA